MAAVSVRCCSKCGGGARGILLPAPLRRIGPSGLLAEDPLILMAARVGEAARVARAAGRFPLLIGGGCPVILGALAPPGLVISRVWVSRCVSPPMTASTTSARMVMRLGLPSGSGS